MIDMHVHFFPAAMFRAIWRYFEKESDGLWKINYKLFGKKHVQKLKDNGVKRFTTLVYAHKPGLAEHLNRFIYESIPEFPEIIPMGTIYAGDPDPAGVARKIFEDYNFYGIKLHPFVTEEMLDDPRFFPAYEIMEAMGKILVCHPGSGPYYDLNDGADRVGNILKQFPNLKVVIAHCGAMEYSEYHPLSDDFPHVYFDTAMNCVHTKVFENNCPGPAFFVRHQDRILYGTDFPNIPYDYSEQLASLQSLNLGPDVEEKIFRGNAERLLGITLD